MAVLSVSRLTSSLLPACLPAFLFTLSTRQATRVYLETPTKVVHAARLPSFLVTLSQISKLFMARDPYTSVTREASFQSPISKDAHPALIITALPILTTIAWPPSHVPP
jgi:hypothetical protein